MGYYLFYFQGYGVFCSIFLFIFRGVGYLEKLIMGIFVSLSGILDCGYWIFVPPPPPIQASTFDYSIHWLRLKIIDDVLYALF